MHIINSTRLIFTAAKFYAGPIYLTILHSLLIYVGSTFQIHFMRFDATEPYLREDVCYL